MKKTMALALRPLEMLKDWVDYVQTSSGAQMEKSEQAASGEATGIDIEFLYLDSPVVVMPLIPNSQRFTAFLYDQAEVILKAAFNKWCSNKKLWPDLLDLNTMMEFFGYDIYTRIHDLGATEIRTINPEEEGLSESHRYAVTVLIRDPAAIKEWLKTVFVRSNKRAEEVENIDFEAMQEDGGLYLLPETVKNYNQALEYFQKNYRVLFEKELMSFTPDKKLWPEELNFALFSRWFQTGFRSIVLS